MLTSSVRIKGERDSWWEDVVNLLSGRGVRRNDPEHLAIERVIRSLRRKLARAKVAGPEPPINLLISHDGTGPRRGVTAVAFTSPPPGPPAEKNMG